MAAVRRLVLYLGFIGRVWPVFAESCVARAVRRKKALGRPSTAGFLRAKALTVGPLEDYIDRSGVPSPRRGGVP